MFYVFTNNSNCYSHILAGIFLMFLKKSPGPNLQPQLNILRWESGRQSIRLVKQEDFCGAIALTYFVENCFELP